ncbi:RDD family protein [Longispora fulva]|uniref:Putative RDD family membrane protein YckC n=1 Tax=Longispora fulva TaxID=619741 RepID=A0A8J7GNR0_9ACTN|nr:RDD family protein [Longispora fulva]MBG6140393.1 putative RDD family membrane protein YckC [Longispora fulva]
MPENAHRLVSGEAVELDVRIARIGSRALALLIDVLVQAAAAGVLALFLLPAATGGDAVLAGAYIIGLVLVLVVLPVAISGATQGRSVGKLALGLRVVRDDGGPITFRHALTRTLVAVAAEWPGLALPPLTWLASLWMMLVHPHGKRIGDLTAGTIVIHDRAPAQWGWIPVPPAVPGLAEWARNLDLSGLPDDLALAVRHYLARNRSLRPEARQRLGYALAAEVMACTTPPAPPNTPGWAYLAAVLAERNRRAAGRLRAARAASAQVWPDLEKHMAVPRQARRPVPPPVPREGQLLRPGAPPA